MANYSTQNANMSTPTHTLLNNDEEYHEEIVQLSAHMWPKLGSFWRLLACSKTHDIVGYKEHQKRECNTKYHRWWKMFCCCALE